MRNCLATYPDYKLVLTGHSLGAGVATLLTLLWTGTLTDDSGSTSSIVATDRVHRFAFAPPCSVSEEFHVSSQYGDVCRQMITSIVLRNDLVCRLNAGTVRDFYQTLVSSESK